MAPKPTPLRELPIDRLPRELLENVLDTSLQGRRYPILRAEELMLVCKYWCDVIENCPRFWADLRGSHTARQLERYITNSCEVPLRISNTHDKQLEKLLQATTPLLDRWQSAAFVVKSANSLQHLVNPAPNLEELSIQASWNQMATFTIPQIFGGQTPHLLKLSLSHVVLAGVATLLPTLRDLHVATPSIAANWADIHLLLTAAPRLACLSLRFEIHRNPFERFEDHMPPIDLPFLQSLELSLDPWTLQSTLTHLRASPTRQVRIKSTLGGISVPFGSMFDLLIPVMTTSRSIRINLGEGGLFMQNPSGSISLFLGERRSGGVNREEAGSIFEELVQSFPDECPRRVVLSLGPDEGLQQRIFSFLSNRQLKPGSHVLAWPLPGLKYLTLETSNRGSPLEALRTLVRCRSLSDDDEEMDRNALPSVQGEQPSRLLGVLCRGQQWEFEDVSDAVLGENHPRDDQSRSLG